MEGGSMRGRMTKWTIASIVALGLLVTAPAPAAPAERGGEGGGRRVAGSFAGEGEFVNEPCEIPEVPDQAGIGVAFTATGRVSSFGRTEFDGIVCLDPRDATAFGPLTLSSRRGTITGDLDGAVSGSPGLDPTTFDLDYTVTGGTGAFRRASGTLAVDLTVAISPFPIQVEGTIDGTLRRHRR
jgi:hypothetical protein